jgi:hypothetical protein
MFLPVHSSRGRHSRPNGMKPTRAPWNRDPNSTFTLKNEWDFDAFELHDESRPPILHLHTYGDLELGFGYDDDNIYPLMANKLTYADGTMRRAILDIRTTKMYLLPDPPNPTFDRAHLYTTPHGNKIPRDLWELMFYTIKPFIDEEVCNAVQSDSIDYNVLLQEYDLIFWAVKHLYSRHWTPRVLTTSERIQFSRVYKTSFLSLIRPIIFRKGDYSLLDEADWRKMLMTFGDAFMDLLGQDVVDECVNCHLVTATYGSTMRRCGGCNAQLYCSKTCQKEDWHKRHKHHCRWQGDRCANCHASVSQMRRCGRCHQALYCSKTCQKEDWHRGHKNKCQSATNINNS